MQTAIINHLEQAIVLDPDYTAPRYELALQLLHAKASDAARQAFTETIDCAVGCVNNFVQAATNCRQTNDFAKAKQYLHRMNSENLLAAKAYCHLGDLLVAETDRTGAKQKYSTALEFDATYAKAHYELGKLEEQAGMLLLAREHYYNAVAHEFTLAAAHLRLAVVISGEDDFELAQNHYLIALDLDPTLEEHELNIRYNNLH